MNDRRKSSEPDQVLITWFNLHVSEGVEIYVDLLKEQAKVFHEELGLTYKYESETTVVISVTIYTVYIVREQNINSPEILKIQQS